MRNGRGTSYNEDGTIEFDGTFVNDKLENIDLLNFASNEVGKYIMNNIFDGGINLKTKLIKFTPGDVRIKIVFNGDVIPTNLYEMTLIIKDTAPFVDFIDYNDNTEAYLTLKLTATVAKNLYDLFKEDSSKK